PPLYSPPRTFGVADDPVKDFASSRVNPATNYGPAQPAATENIRGWDTNRTDPARPNLNSPAANNFGGSIQPPYNNPPASDLYPNNFANNQNNNLRSNGPQLPAAGNAPYRPGVGYDTSLQNGNQPDHNHFAAGQPNPNLNGQNFNGPNQTGFNNSVN